MNAILRRVRLTSCSDYALIFRRSDHDDSFLVQSDYFDLVNRKSRVQRTTSKNQLHHLKVMIPSQWYFFTRSLIFERLNGTRWYLRDPSVIIFFLVSSDYPDTHFTCITAGSLWQKINRSRSLCIFSSSEVIFDLSMNLRFIHDLTSVQMHFTCVQINDKM